MHECTEPLFQAKSLDIHAGHEASLTLHVTLTYIHTKLGVARLIVFEGRWGMHD